MDKIIISDLTPIEDYQELFEKGVGYVFKIEGDYEAVTIRLQLHKPANWDFYPITPGTKPYMLTGPSHCIVTKA